MKRKIAVISLVVMLVAVGVGYAANYFADTLDVQGTATSSTFDVRFSAVEQEFSNVKVDILSQIGSGNPEDRIKVTATELMPGVLYTAKIALKNVGSVDAKIIDYKITNPDADTNYDIVKVEPIFSPEEMASFVLPAGETSQTFVVTFKLDATKIPANEGLSNPLTGSFSMWVKFAEATATL